MRIGGFVKQSLIDWEGVLSAVVFTKGCNFRCDYCHNPSLVLPSLTDHLPDLSETVILDYLRRRREWIEGVVVTGGEPTLHPGLTGFLERVKRHGYRIKLDTNGTNTELLSALIDSKTTLAAQLAERFPQSITVHTDDFYLPPSRRVTGWEKILCANMDIRRLRNEVVAPARAGQAFSYRAYSCREDAYLPPRPLGSAPLVIVEGSYSHHPSLAPYYDIRIFVTCSPDEQARRLRKREGELYSNFVERWIPLEEGYFANYSIEENAEMMVVTD